MKKPRVCSVQVEYCENCNGWEPIPFHPDGGLCLKERSFAVGKLSADDTERRLVRNSSGYAEAAVSLQLAAIARGAANKTSPFNVMNVIYR